MPKSIRDAFESINGQRFIQLLNIAVCRADTLKRLIAESDSEYFNDDDSEYFKEVIYLISKDEDDYNHLLSLAKLARESETAAGKTAAGKLIWKLIDRKEWYQHVGQLKLTGELSYKLDCWQRPSGYRGIRL